MIDPDTIDYHIRFMADALQTQVEESEIKFYYAAEGFTEGEIFLLLSAAKLLRKDRDAPKPLFKRVT